MRKSSILAQRKVGSSVNVLPVARKNWASDKPQVNLIATYSEQQTIPEESSLDAITSNTHSATLVCTKVEEAPAIEEDRAAIEEAPPILEDGLTAVSTSLEPSKSFKPSLHRKPLLLAASTKSAAR